MISIESNNFRSGFEKKLKKSQLGYDYNKFIKLCIVAGLFSGLIFSVFTFFVLGDDIPVYYLGIIFISVFFIVSLLVLQIPHFALQNRKAMLESDLLYSARHLLLKLQSGSSLLNSMESVSMLETKSGKYFKEVVFDITMGMTIENALEKAMEYSPSSSFTKILEEINTSLKTGSDLERALGSTIKDITKEHLIAIQEYGRKLNPMSMVYMIIGTILPSMGTAMIVVVSSLQLIEVIVDNRILLSIAFLLLVIQVFFVLAFRSLKPAVME